VICRPHFAAMHDTGKQSPEGDLAALLAWLKDQRHRSDSIGGLACEVGDHAPHWTLWKSISDLRRHLRWYGTLGSRSALARALAEFNVACAAPRIRSMRA
jgi:hypothetical protein